jgi:hypothetical protein
VRRFRDESAAITPGVYKEVEIRNLVSKDSDYVEKIKLLQK